MDTQTAIPPPRPLEGNPVSIPEIADMVGVDNGAINLWRYRFGADSEVPFPEPDDRIGNYPVWRLERITAWLNLTNRQYDVERWREKKAAGGYRRATSLDGVNAARKKAAAKKAAAKPVRKTAAAKKSAAGK